MAAFTAQDVKNLREKTGCGMMDCKKALTEANGDEAKAIELLREKGLATAAKKSGRIAAEGVVCASNSADNKTAAILEVNAATDFVAKNESFVNFVNKIVSHIVEVKPASVEELMDQKCGEATVREMLTENIAKIGENMNIRRFSCLEGDYVQTYIHGGGRIGVVVSFQTDLADQADFQVYAKDVAMQIAAMNPSYLNEAAVPAEVIEKEKEILLAQALNEGKPEAIAQKMVNGRIAKYYKEICLEDQLFFKDDSMDVKKFTQETAKKLGGSIQIVSFTRYEKGEGLEKREENFAEEIAKLNR